MEDQSLFFNASDRAKKFIQSLNKQSRLETCSAWKRKLKKA